MHRYPTRFQARLQEKALPAPYSVPCPKDVTRDCENVCSLIAVCSASTDMAQRIAACIDLFHYLRWNPCIIQRSYSFRATMLKKMEEFEKTYLSEFRLLSFLKKVHPPNLESILVASKNVALLESLMQTCASLRLVM